MCKFISLFIKNKINYFYYFNYFSLLLISGDEALDDIGVLFAVRGIFCTDDIVFGKAFKYSR